VSRGRGTAGWIGLAALLLFMAFVVWRSLHVAGVRCEVCITYRGLTQCRTVDGPTEEEARTAATSNACAYLAGGVTDGLACSRTPPDRAACTPIE
jgi:hypothetical protein